MCPIRARARSLERKLPLHRREGKELSLEAFWVPLLRLRTRVPGPGRPDLGLGSSRRPHGPCRPVQVAQLTLDLVEQDALHLYTPEEGAVLKVAVQTGGAEVWRIVMNPVQTGSWKLEAQDGRRRPARWPRRPE